jgi:NitT/TauT family transport system ATP-binding protein
MSTATMNAPVASPTVATPIATHAAVDTAGLKEKVTIRNLDFFYGESKALKGISLPLYANKATAFIGPSGCGKSTLLELIAGLTPASEGTVEFEGRPIAGEAPDGVGVVFQEDASLPWLDVTENVAFGLRRSNLAKDVKTKRVRDALDLVGLSDFATSYPAQLSGGMRQRVCIARTLVMQPRLILLDEPFGALDQQTRLLMGDELLRMWRETDATVFLITHALDEATMLADRIGAFTVLVAGHEPAGQRDLSMPGVRDGISQTLRGRKDQLMRAAYLTAVRSDATVVNYFARRLLESKGEMPTVPLAAPGR